MAARTPSRGSRSSRAWRVSSDSSIRWSEDELRDVVAFSQAQGIRIWVWRHRNTLEDREKRRALFASLQKMGIAGVKVDFLDHEAKEVIDLYQDILRDDEP